MPQTFKIKNSSVADKVPAAGDLATAELALNLKDQKLYSKDADGTVFEIGQSIAQNLQEVLDEGNTAETELLIEKDGNWVRLRNDGSIEANNNLKIGTDFGGANNTGVFVGGHGYIGSASRQKGDDLMRLKCIVDGNEDLFKVDADANVSTNGEMLSGTGTGSSFVGVQLRPAGNLTIANVNGTNMILATSNGDKEFKVDDDAHVTTDGGVTSVFGTSAAQVGNVAPLNDWSCYPARA